MGSENSMSALAWGMLLALGLIWGGSFFFARIAVMEVPAITLVFLRLSIAAIALHIYIAGRFGIYRLLRSHWKQFLFLGLINNAVPHVLIFLGETKIGAGLAAVLNATTPIWTVIVGNFLTDDERLTPAKIGGCLMGLVGAAVLIGPDLVATDEAPLWALLLPILAAVSYAFAAIYGKRFRGLPAPSIAAGQLSASSLLVLPVSLVIDRPWEIAMPSAGSIGSILALALLSTAFAYILYFRIMELAGATNATLVTLLVPPGAILLGAVFLGERLNEGEIAGMTLIGAGLVILDGRFFRRLAANP
jgi:drug/metabolite transporter (DMT)-like permease